MKIIENISDEGIITPKCLDLVELNIPTATPILYEFGHNM
jgi:bisphosphoglycerate-dependent phosphoglycerate mutase